MTVGLVGVEHTGTTTGTASSESVSLSSITSPQTPAAVDVALLIADSNSGAAVTIAGPGGSSGVESGTSTEWTIQQGVVNSSSIGRIATWTRVLTSTDISTDTVGVSLSSACSLVEMLLVLRGFTVDTTAGDSAINESTGVTTIPFKAVTPTFNNSYVVQIVTGTVTATNTAATLSATPAGWTLLDSVQNTSTSNRVFVAAYGQQLGTGTAGTPFGGSATATVTNSHIQNYGMVFAPTLPAGGGPNYSTALLDSYLTPANALDQFATLDSTLIVGY